MNTQLQPQNPVQAVTFADPYPYYRELVATRPLYYDDTLRLWVASNAQAVNAVLCSEICRVRPITEPIPRLLQDSAAGAIFGHLVRMNDGPDHAVLKQAVSSVLGNIDMAVFQQISQRRAERLFANAPNAPESPDDPGSFAFQLPLYVIGEMLGIAQDRLGEVAGWVRDFVRCLSPLSTPAQIEQAKDSSRRLLEAAHRTLDHGADGLFTLLAQAVQQTHHPDAEVIAANGIGFLSQAYEATAALIGNTVLALARHPEILEQVRDNPDLLVDVIEEVIRADAPIQNTRRYVAENGIVAGQAMKAGDTVLVVLAAANHDSAANPAPERFEIHRRDRQSFTFGIGAHACPGQVLAAAIAQAGVRQLLRSNISFVDLAENFAYQESVNARIPIFSYP